MSPEQIENQEIWKQVKGAEKLFEIYECFPTLHDAEIKKIDVNLENREFYLTVDYNDFIKAPGDEVSTRFTLRWRNVRKADFKWYAEVLIGMEFSKAGDFIKTKFDQYGYGFDGEIIAGEIEVVDVEIGPENDENNRGIIKFSID